MTKNLISMLITILMISQITAQTQFENPGFEEWESIPYGSIPEPIDWSSARTALPDELAQVAPPIWDQSEDSHSGNYSVYLVNKAAFGIIATGTITTGRIYASLEPADGYVFTDLEDSRWNTPFDQLPDSVVGWYKAKPSTGDFATVQVLLHKGYASIPTHDSSNWIALAKANLSTADVDEWTRFSVPFQYFSNDKPEYILAVITAGNGLNAIENSEAWFDDFKLIYNNTSVGELYGKRLSVHYSCDYLNVWLDNPPTGQARLIVSDISGRHLLIKEFRSRETNRFRFQHDPGIYLVTVEAEETTLTKKIVVR